MRAVFSLIRWTRINQHMESHVLLTNPLTAQNASDIPPVLERGTHLLFSTLFPRFLGFPCDRAVGAFTFRGVLPSDVIFVLYTNRALEIASIFLSEPPNIHFCTMHSPHGPTVNAL